MLIDHQIAELARVIERARHAVVFTGAGISTESGIPDFRSPGGIWTKMAPIDFSDFLASEETRDRTAVTAPLPSSGAAARPSR